MTNQTPVTPPPGTRPDETVFSLRPQYRKGGHRVTVDCPADIELDSFPGAISQIVTNLVMNSTIHAFPDGKAGELTLAVRRLDGDRIELRYSDDGRGIPPEHRERIFEPFFTTRRGQGGSGLGLHISSTIWSSRSSAGRCATKRASAAVRRS